MPAVTVPTDPAVKDPTEASLAAAINKAIADINSNVSAITEAGVPNGSFEFDLEVSGEPDAWTISDNSGGSHSLTTTDEGHGAQALECTVTAVGGWVEVLSDEYQVCQPGERIQVEFAAEATVATARIRAQVLLYNAAKTILSTTDVFDSAAGNPAAYFKFGGPERSLAIPAGTARFYRVKLIAGEVSNTVDAIVRFDGVGSYIRHGGVPLARTSKGTISTNTTTTIDVSGQIGNDQSAHFVDIHFDCNWDVISGGSPTVTVQGWVGGAWTTVYLFRKVNTNDANQHEAGISVPLDDSNQFRIVTTSLAGTDSFDVYVGGKYEV